MKSLLASFLPILCSIVTIAQYNVDFRATTLKNVLDPFSANIVVTVTRFENASKADITLPDGSTTSITSQALHGATYDAASKTLKITIQVMGQEVFLEANDRSDIGAVTLARGQQALLTITPSAAPANPVPPGTALVPDNFDPTGYALMDALSLVNCTKRSEFTKIMRYYFGANADLTNLEAFLKSQANPYLKDNDVLTLLGQKKDDNIVVGVGGLLGKAVAAAGGLDVTTIADGFAKFLVKRSKEELSAAFFDRFKRDLEKEEYKDLRTIFPQTYRTLQSIGDDIYMFQAYIQSLRESFEKDLAALLGNLPAILENHSTYFDARPELKASLQSAFYIGLALQENVHPGEIIEDYPIGYVESFPNIKASFQTLQLLSASLRDEEREGYWADGTTIKKLAARDGLLLKLYLGLLQQQAGDIVFDPTGRKLTLSEVVNSAYPQVASNVPEYRKYFSGLSEQIAGLETSIQALKRSTSDSIRFENYYAVISQSVALMRYLSDAEKLPQFPSGLNIRSTLIPYFDALDATSGIVIDVHRRNYASAIMNCVYLYNLKKSTDATSVSPETSSRLLKYGSFMAAMVQAKSSAEVQDAIEAVALPAGSSRIKRTVQFNVALNAYLGLHLGEEHINVPGSKEQWGPIFGLSAPIGVAVSKRIGKNGGSVSLFVSLIDIGAVASYRFENETTTQLPPIKLENIFAPGLYAVYGIPRTPISVGYGWQKGPQLREVAVFDPSNPGATVNTNVDGYRWSFFIAVDIPLINFYSSSR